MTNISQTGATTFSTGTGNISLNGSVVTNISQTGATTFSTGSGAVSLNGDVTVAANKNFTQSGTGTFSTGTGAVSLNGSTTLAANKNVTAAAGTGAFDFSAATGTFKTSTGAVSLNGDVTIAQGKTLVIAGTNGTGSTAITAHYSNTATLDFASIAKNTCSNLTITVTGARAGDTAIATPTGTAGGAETLGVNWNTWVSGNDTVTLRLCADNAGPADPASQTWRADVWRH